MRHFFCIFGIQLPEKHISGLLYHTLPGGLGFPSMKPELIAEITDAEIVFCSPAWCETDIQIGCSSDLMSDILTLDVTNAIMITGLANEQAIRTAEMAEIHTILLVRSKIPSKAMRELAEACEISLMRTRHTMFTVCGRLMKAGLKSPY